MTRFPAGFWVVVCLDFTLPLGYGVIWTDAALHTVVAQSVAVVVFGLLGLYLAQFVLIYLLDTVSGILFGLTRLSFLVLRLDRAWIDRAEESFVSTATTSIVRVWSFFLPKKNERNIDA